MNTTSSSQSALVQSIVGPLKAIGVSADAAGTITTVATANMSRRSLADYAHLAIEGTWSEATAQGPAIVSAKVWTRALQKALDENVTVHIPASLATIYLDGPVVIRSGQRLLIDDGVELRLKPDTSTCMIRNEHPTPGKLGPVSDANPDRDIVIDGGTWTTLAVTHQESNGNWTGGPDRANALHGHGTVLLNNVRGVVVRNVTIKECRPHGIQLSNVSEFLIENIRFVNHGRDGVHINGPTSFGVVRNVRGVTWDDMVAINAWDWKNTCMAFGPIHDIVVEDVHAGSAESDYRAHMRLLGGTKHFDDGGRIACDIYNIVVRDVSRVETFKMYDQPNLEVGVNIDFADPIGDFRNLYFSDITLHQPREHAFPIASNIDGLTIDRVTMMLKSPTSFAKLVHIGPMSATYQPNPADPSTWVEVFSPNKDCTVRGLSLTNVCTQLATDAKSKTPVDPQQCIDVVQQKVNADYPRTTPRGGTGKGILIK